jgi:hypothetical protein
MSVGTGAQRRVRAGPPPLPYHASPAQASPVSPRIEKVLIHDVLQGHTDPGRQLPEEARRELSADLGEGCQNASGTTQQGPPAPPDFIQAERQSSTRGAHLAAPCPP